MSLRTKLYLAFIVMIVLVAFTGFMAIRAFVNTNRVVEATRTQVSNVSNILVPTNQLVTQVYTDVNQAALLFHAYSFNRLGADFEEGMKNVGQIKERSGKIEELMKRPDADMLASSRGLLQQTKSDVALFETQANSLNASMSAVDDLQKRIDVSLGETQEVLDALYERTMDDVGLQFADRAAVGMTPLRERIMESWKFLDDLFNEMARAELLFWKGRGKFGEEAAAVFKEASAVVLEQRDLVKSHIDAGNFDVAEVEAGYNDLLNRLATYSQLIVRFADEWNRSTTINLAMASASEKVLDAFDALDGATSGMVIDNAEKAYEGTAKIDAIVDRSTVGSAVILAIAVIIGALLAFFITRGIVNPINVVIGNLSHEEEVLGEAASHISDASQDLAEGVTEQAASLEETSSALEQVSAMVKASAGNARNTNSNTKRTAELVSSGAADMKEMSAAMAKINEQADRISNIIKTIEEIAFQTNLLALNAAVEAARAGEAGKGFAVVADEVRSLSGRSAQAAKDTAELINATVESVRSGSDIVQRLSGGYSEIESGIGSIGDLIGQIANAADEQSQGVEQINTAVSQMDKITQQNASGASECAASVQNLEGQITDLRDNIAVLQSIVHGGTKKLMRGASGGGRGKAVKAAVSASRQLPGPAVMRPDFIE